jgi:hypothetical protein
MPTLSFSAAALFGLGDNKAAKAMAVPSASSRLPAVLTRFIFLPCRFFARDV